MSDRRPARPPRREGRTRGSAGVSLAREVEMRCRAAAVLVLMVVALGSWTVVRAQGPAAEPAAANVVRGSRLVPVEEEPGVSDYHAKWAVIVGIDDYSRGEGFGRLQN